MAGVHIEFELEFNSGDTEAVATQAGTAERVAVDDPPPEKCLNPYHVGPNFETNRFDLSTDGHLMVAQIVTMVDEAPCVRDERGTTCAGTDAAFAVEGHTDERDSYLPGGNEMLSQHRAEAVAVLLRSLGAAQHSIKGFAALYPAPAPIPDHRTDAERWHDDRRVTLRLWCPPGG